MQIQPDRPSAQPSFGAGLNSPPSFPLHTLLFFPPAEIIRLHYAPQATQNGDFLRHTQRRELSAPGLQEPVPHPKLGKARRYQEPGRSQRFPSPAPASRRQWKAGEFSWLSAALRAAGCTQHKRHTKRWVREPFPGLAPRRDGGDLFPSQNASHGVQKP